MAVSPGAAAWPSRWSTVCAREREAGVGLGDPAPADDGDRTVPAAGDDELRELLSLQPRPRGKLGEISAGVATAYGQWLSSKLEALKGQPRARRLREDRLLVESLSELPPLESSWDARHRWKTCVEGRWRWVLEHIHIKEARVLLLGLRRHCRSPKYFGTRLLGITDSLVSACAFDKGSLALLPAQRALSARRRPADRLLGGLESAALVNPQELRGR